MENPSLASDEELRPWQTIPHLDEQIEESLINYELSSTLSAPNKAAPVVIYPLLIEKG